MREIDIYIELQTFGICADVKVNILHIACNVRSQVEIESKDARGRQIAQRVRLIGKERQRVLKYLCHHHQSDY